MAKDHFGFGNILDLRCCGLDRKSGTLRPSYGRGGGSLRAFRQAKQKSSRRRIATGLAPFELWIGTIREGDKRGAIGSVEDMSPTPDKNKYACMQVWQLLSGCGPLGLD